MYIWILVFFTVLLKNRNIKYKIKRSKVTDYAALNLPWKVLEKHSKALKSPWILPFTGGLDTVFWDLNHNKIMVPLFGAAYAAPNKGTTILYLFSKTNIFSNAL